MTMTENDRIEGSKDALPEVLLVYIKYWLLIWYVRFAYYCFNVLCLRNLYISRALFHIRQSHSVSDFLWICKTYSKNQTINESPSIINYYKGDWQEAFKTGLNDSDCIIIPKGTTCDNFNFELHVPTNKKIIINRELHRK